MNMFKLLENPNCCINCMRSGMTLQETPFYGGWSSYYTLTQSSFNCRSHHPLCEHFREVLATSSFSNKKNGHSQAFSSSKCLALISCEKMTQSWNTRPNSQGNWHIHQAPLSCLCLCPFHGPSLFQRNSDR